MGVLWTDLKAFYDNVKLRQLTNTNTPGAGSITDAVGLQAESVALATFKRIVGITPDLTNADHENVLFSAVVYTLEFWANKLGENWRERRQAVYDEFKELQQVTARKRVSPVTSSPDVPTDDTYGGAIQDPKPAFDLTRWNGIQPNDPLGAGGGAPVPNPFP